MCKNVLPHINKFFFNVYLKLVFCQGGGLFLYVEQIG